MPRPSSPDLRARLEGISAVPVTPFDQDGAIVEDALATVVARIVEAGIDVVVACGNTAEQASLTVDEAEQVTALTIEAAGAATVIVGVGGDLRTACRRTARAVELGAAGVMVHYPTDPYVSDDGLIRYYAEIVQASDGVVIPYVRGQGLSHRVFESLAGAESVVAVKYALPDVIAFADVAARYGEAFVPVCGLAELWAPYFWLAGARGFTSGLASVYPTLSVAMLDALRAGDYAAAMDVWQAIAPFERLRSRHASANNVPVVKEAMAILGVIGPTVRAPLTQLSPEDRAELESTVETLAARG